jgi:hypothetical protein
MNKLLFLLFCFPLFLFSQNWNQIGQDIDGEAAGDWSGRISLSSDGNTLAIGAIHNDGNGTSAGHVRIFNYNGSSWSQLGQDLDGEGAGNEFGFRSSFSTDGSIVAIGSKHNSSSGHVRIYRFSGSNWQQLGNDIDGESSGDQSGSSVSLSSDGYTVAIGAQYNGGGGGLAGHVRIYNYNGSSWNQVGQDIDGEAAGDHSGASASLSSDGNTLAVGALHNDGNGTSAGHVRIFNYNGSSWVQIGQDLDGESAGDQSGSSISLSSDASIIAIGARFNAGNGTDAGHVRIYEFDGSSWIQLGNDLDGEAASDYFGQSVSLSSDGDIVFIGAHWNDGNGADAGHARAYSYNGSTWLQLGNDIDGEDAGDSFGCSVSLSGDGSVGAVGAYRNAGNGSLAGHVRIFNLTTPGCTDSLACNYDASANTDDGSCDYATSTTTVTTCDSSYTWNDSSYTQSGTYSYSGASNNYSMSFDGINDYVLINSQSSSLDFYNKSNITISSWVSIDDLLYL